MKRAALTTLLLGVLLVGVAACGGGEEVSPTPETVIGTLPEGTTEEAPASTVEGDAAAGEEVFTANGCGSCHTLEAAGTSGLDRAESRRVAARHGARRRPRDERRRRDACVRRAALRAADRRRRRLRRRKHLRLSLKLPADFPPEVEAVACDLDRTSDRRRRSALAAHARGDRCSPRDAGSRS